MDHVCKNCEHEFDGVYCNNCGQKFDAPQFTFKHIIEEGFHAFTHADKSFLGFLKKLIIDPGNLAWEYIVERKRKKYFNPFTFFVLISAINAFVTSINLNLKENLFHQHNEYGYVFNIYSKILELAIIPIFALIIWLIHSKKPRLRYSEYTVFAMILLSLFSLVEIVAHFIDYTFTSLLHSDVSIEDNIVYVLAFVAYTAYANYRFHIKMKKSSVVKSALVGVSAFAVQLSVLLFFIWAFIRHFHGIGNFVLFGIKLT